MVRQPARPAGEGARQRPHPAAILGQPRRRETGGVSELRIDYGPGYRVYFVQRGQTLMVLLAGGDKDTQDRDIRRALELAREL